MVRYIALSWDHRSEKQAQWVTDRTERLLSSSCRWKRVFNRNGLAVLCILGGHAYQTLRYLPDDAGVMLGNAFELDPTDSLEVRFRPAPDRISAGNMISQQGVRAVIARYWGRYVAFASLLPQNSRLIIRSPATGLPCYRTMTPDGIAIFFSDIEAYSALPDSKLAINWNYISRRAAFGPSKTTDTALTDVFEVQDGQCAEHSASGCSQAYLWNPFTVATSKPLEKPDRAASALEATAIACAQAWSSCHPAIIHRLSGGLDSSITLAAFAASRESPRITCLNYYIPNIGASDERRYARLVAEAAGCSLVERSRPVLELRLESLFTLPFCVNPHPYVGHFDNLGFERELSHSTGATALSSGDPGDVLFCRYRLDLALIDMIRHNGLSRDALRFAERIAQIEGVSIWKALRKALLYRPGQGGELLLGSTNNAPRPLINPELPRFLRNQTRYEQHPLWPPPPDIPPGKLLQIMALMSFVALYTPIGGQFDDPEEVFPLMSQPLLEVCLRIPSYTHCLDGVSRGLARTAFARRLPADILTRFWKGRPGRRSKDIILSQAPLLKELLLEGLLIKEGILDRARLEDALSGQPTQSKCHSLHIFEHLLTELWLRSCFQQPHYSPIRLRDPHPPAHLLTTSVFALQRNTG